MQLPFTIKGKQFYVVRYAGLFYVTTAPTEEDLISPGTWYYVYEGGVSRNDASKWYTEEEAVAEATKLADVPANTGGGPVYNPRLWPYFQTEKKTPAVAELLIEQLRKLAEKAPGRSFQAQSKQLVERLQAALNHYRQNREPGSRNRSSSSAKLISDTADATKTVCLMLDRLTLLTEEQLAERVDSIVELGAWTYLCDGGCGARVPTGFNEDGYIYCVACHDRYYRQCTTCTKLFHRDKLRKLGDTWTCPTCPQPAHFTCHGCGNVIYGEPRGNPENNVTVEQLAEIGKKLCRACVRHWCNCDCGHLSNHAKIAPAKLVSVEDDELMADEEERARSVVCVKCYESNYYRFRPEYWNSDSIRPYGESFEQLKSRRKYGLEIEVIQAANLSKLPLGIKREWDCKGDASLPENGFELCSVPLSGDEGLELVEQLCNYAQKQEWVVNQRAGLHIHLDLSAHHVNQVAAVAAGYLMTEMLWRCFVAPSRQVSKYCVTHRMRPDQYIDLPANKMLNALQNDMPEDPGHARRKWINWLAYSKFNTVENRLHQGTLNAEKIINWVKANALFVDWCVAQKTQKKVEELLLEPATSAQKMLDFMAENVWQDRELANWFAQRAKKFMLGGVPNKPTCKLKPTPAQAGQVAAPPAPPGLEEAARRFRTIVQGTPADLPYFWTATPTVAPTWTELPGGWRAATAQPVNGQVETAAEAPADADVEF